MDSKEQVVLMLKNENEYLKKENEFLKAELIRLTGSYPNMDGGSMIMQQKLPRIQSQNTNRKNDEIGKKFVNLEKEIEMLKGENNKIKKDKEIMERQNTNLKNENEILISKLNNLETVFIGSTILRNKDGTVTNDLGDNYSMSAVLKFLKLAYFGKY
jgi:cell division protein FtsB